MQRFVKKVLIVISKIHITKKDNFKETLDLDQIFFRNNLFYMIAQKYTHTQEPKKPNEEK